MTTLTVAMETSTDVINVRTVASDIMFNLQCHKRLADYVKRLGSQLNETEEKLTRATSSGNIAATQMYLLRIQVTKATKEMYELALQKKWNQVNTMATHAMRQMGMESNTHVPNERISHSAPRLPARHYDTSNVFLRDLALHQGRCV